MKLGLILNGVKSLGPGSRLCIWFAGCPHDCPSCATPQLKNAQRFVDQDILLALSKENLSNVTGITVSGGEPFMQVQALNQVLDFADRAGIYDVLVYSGYTLQELKDFKDGDTDRALSRIAVLIDGRYVYGLDKGQRLQGSENQTMHIFKQEYRNLYDGYCNSGRTVQVKYKAGGVHVVGLTPKILREKEKTYE